MHIETLLPISKEFNTQYDFYKENGKNFLSTQKICIISLTRNTSYTINNVISSLVQLGNNAKDYKIIFFENDSSDNTVELINNWISNNPNISLLTETYNKPQYGQVQDIERTILLAEYRNKLKYYIQENYSDYDFVIVTDSDFQNFSLDGVYNSFGWLFNDQNIGAMCGNSFQYKRLSVSDSDMSLWNYDSWAYRGSWWNNLQTHKSAKISYDPMVWFGLQVLPVGSYPFRINSGFGGMTIYRTKFYLSADYSGEDCEHVMFHYNLKQKNPEFHLFLNPSQRMLLS
jgi:glycosyltransferase involved in cell wall biosynthesis